MYLHIAPSISAAIIASGSAFAQAPPPAAVSSDRLADVPLTTSGNDLLSFYNYSWSSFIALNWPAQKGPGNRGLADRSAFGDTDGPRVWMTWKSRCEIFQPGGVLPSPWASYDGQNPCGPDFVNDAVTLSSFSAFGDFNQAGFGLNNPANPLVAQNHTYVRYEVRVNEPEFNSIVGNKWYIANNLPSAATAVPFNVDSTEIKAAWRILTEIDRPNRGRYYVARNAQVFDVATGKCTRQDVALVGLHIVTKTRERPQWIWSTFEHIDNVPNITEEPTPPPTVRFSFNNREEVQTLIPPPAMRPRPISPIYKQ